MFDFFRGLMNRVRADDDDSTGGGLPQGARGYAARDRYLAALSERPEEFVAEFRRLLAREMEVAPAALTPASLRGFFDRHVVFTTDPPGRLLACFGALVSHFWELSETNQGPQLRASLVAAAAFVEQAALDRNRLDMAWLYTGLQEPRPSLPAARAPRRPATALLPPRWLAAHIAYTRDVDFLTARAVPPPVPAPLLPAAVAAALVPAPKRPPRGGAKAKAAPEPPAP